MQDLQIRQYNTPQKALPNPPIFASKPLPQEGGGREGAFPPPKVAPVRDIGFFTTFSRVKSIELYMDLQVQNVAFLHDFLIEHNEGLNLRVCHFAGSACLGPSRPPIFASKPLPQEGGGRAGAVLRGYPWTHVYAASCTTAAEIMCGWHTC